MSTDASKHHESVIQISMLLAQKNGYSTEAWRLFEAEAETVLVNMEKHQTPERPHDLATS